VWQLKSKSFPKHFPRTPKMSALLPAMGGGPITPPSSRPSSPARPAPRTDNLVPSFGNFTGHTDAVMLSNMCEAITELNLWDWLRTFTPKENEGFMWSRSPEINQIASHPKVDSDGHSGASFAWTMRNMEVIAKRGWYHYYYEYIVPNIAKQAERK
jgi:hypothetical protein